MLDPKIIGRRLKYFRQRVGISQLDLEIALDMSQGSVSRIESGKVNPTKETVLSIAGNLQMNDREISYVIGPLALPPTQKEVENAIHTIQEDFSRDDVYAYLIDDRFRFHYISKGFENLLNIILENYQERYLDLVGTSLFRIVLDERIGINQFIKGDVSQVLISQLLRFNKYMGFMVDDEYYSETLNLFAKYPGVSELWKQIENDNLNFNSLESKKVSLSFESLSFDTIFVREPIAKYPRFETIEYVFSHKDVIELLKVLNAGSKDNR